MNWVEKNNGLMISDIFKGRYQKCNTSTIEIFKKVWIFITRYDIIISIFIRRYDINGETEGLFGQYMIINENKKRIHLLTLECTLFVGSMFNSVVLSILV